MDQADDEAGTPLTRWPTLGTLDGRTNVSQRRRSMSRDLPSRFRQFSDIRSAASDPADLFSNSGLPAAVSLRGKTHPIEQQQQDKDQTDADGDDELMTNDDDDEEADTTLSLHVSKHHRHEAEDYFSTPNIRHEVAAPSSSLSSSSQRQTATALPRAAAPPRRHGLHDRTLSTNTILYAPQDSGRHSPSPSSIAEEILPPSRPRPRTRRLSNTVEQAGPSGVRSPRKTPHVFTPTRPRPIPSRSAPNRAALIQPRQQQQQQQQHLRGPSSIDVDAASEMGLLDAGPDFGGMVPSSFATQMALATGQLKGLGLGRGRGVGTSTNNQGDRGDRESSDRLSRLVLARMKTLEEGFADVVKEMREMRSAPPSSQDSDAAPAAPASGPRSNRSGRRQQRRTGANTPATAIATPSVPSSVAGKSAGSSGNKRTGGRGKGKGKMKEGQEEAVEEAKGPAVIESEHDGNDDDDDDDDDVAARRRRKGSSF